MCHHLIPESDKSMQFLIERLHLVPDGFHVIPEVVTSVKVIGVILDEGQTSKFKSLVGKPLQIVPKRSTVHFGQCWIRSTTLIEYMNWITCTDTALDLQGIA